MKELYTLQYSLNASKSSVFVLYLLLHNSVADNLNTFVVQYASKNLIAQEYEVSLIPIINSMIGNHSSKK